MSVDTFFLHYPRRPSTCVTTTSSNNQPISRFTPLQPLHLSPAVAVDTQCLNGGSSYLPAYCGGCGNLHTALVEGTETKELPSRPAHTSDHWQSLPGSYGVSSQQSHGSHRMQMPTKDAHPQFEKWAREYGPVYSLILGTKTMVTPTARKCTLDKHSAPETFAF